MERVRVYLCREKELRSPVHRHFVAPVALCEDRGYLGLDEVARVVGEKIVGELVEKGEAVIVDERVIELLTGARTGEPVYLRLVLERSRSTGSDGVSG